MTTRRPLRRLRSRLLAALSLFAIAAGCGRERETGYEGPFEREVDRAIPQLEESTGLPFKTPPKLELRTRDQVREFLEAQFNEQLTPLELSGVETAYKRLGLLPDTLDLRGFLLELLTEQVAGYYDPKTKVLYVVEGGSADITSITISHELVHALQDQYFPLDSAQQLKGDNDRQVALQSVIEGQAMYEQMASMLGGSDFGLRLPGGWDQVRETIRNEQASMPLFANAPVLIQETLLFPYLSGAEFNRQFKRARPGIAPFTPLAASTEQILHPEKLLDSIPDWPTRIELAAPRGASLVHEDNLGEFETRLFLFQHIGDVGTAAQGAKGWDGDRYQLVQVAGGNGIAWLTVWDSAIEAAEYRDLMERMVERRFGVATGTGGTGTTRQWTARGRRLSLTTADLNGRPVVIWEDLPQAARGSVIDLARVTLRDQ
jgi:hypothetical protein